LKKKNIDLPTDPFFLKKIAVTANQNIFKDGLISTHTTGLAPFPQ